MGKRKVGGPNPAAKRRAKAPSFSAAISASSARDVYASLEAKMVTARTLKRVDDRGFSALHMAVETAHYPLLSVLVAAPSAVGLRDLPDSNGNTPLMIAVRSGHEVAVSTLLGWGASVHRTNWNGDAPLTWAARNDDVAIMERLLPKARIDVRNRRGNTPLIVAVKSGAMRTAALLIQRGASIDVCDIAFRTIFEHASGSMLRVIGSAVAKRCASHAEHGPHRLWSNLRMHPPLVRALPTNLQSVAANVPLGNRVGDVIFECTICSTESSDPGLVSTVCGHTACPMCIINWTVVQRQTKCPHCRQLVRMSDYVQIQNLVVKRIVTDGRGETNSS